MDIYNTTLNTVEGTADADNIENYVSFGYVYGREGNDTIFTAGFLNYADGGAGDDRMVNLLPAFFSGGDGNDFIINSSSMGLFSGGAGNDSIVSLSENASSVYLSGEGGSDIVGNAGSGMATLSGGIMDFSYDILISGNGIDIFDVTPYCGVDEIQDYKPQDVVYIHGSIAEWTGQVVDTHVLFSSVYGDVVIVENGALTGVNLFTSDESQAAFEQLVANYKTALGISTSSYDMASDETWSNANEFFGTAQVDNIFVSRTDGNDLVFDTDGADTVHLYDATLSDIVSTSVSDNAIAIEFNTGEVAMVSAAQNTSPTFKFASGQSYVYNRESSSWREA